MGDLRHEIGQLRDELRELRQELKHDRNSVSPKEKAKNKPGKIDDEDDDRKQSQNDDKHESKDVVRSKKSQYDTDVKRAAAEQDLKSKVKSDDDEQLDDREVPGKGIRVEIRSEDGFEK